MASRLAKLAGHNANRLLWPSLRTKSKVFLTPARSLVYTETGAVLEKPVHVRFGLIKVFLIVVPFVTAGGMLSSNVASLLEENEIFVYDEDDD